jgi:uncharacterized protein (DUF488 family)
MHRLFTLGHSAMELSTFLDILKESGITLVIDVRSRPESIRFPHFHQADLEPSLRAAHIRYLHLGEELGGRPDDPKAYRSDGLVNYRARRKSYGFQAGIERVLKELETHDLALLCAEEDPLTCHRFLMICPELVALDVEPAHIRKGGAIETQREAEDRLLESNDLGSHAGPSLFAADRAAALETAYASQAEKAAFRVSPEEIERWQS